MAFIVPAILRDGPAVPVALTGTVVIALVALYLAHGVRITTTVALAGTLLSLALIVVLAAAAASAAAHRPGRRPGPDPAGHRRRDRSAGPAGGRHRGRCARRARRRDRHAGLHRGRPAPGQPHGQRAGAVPRGDPGGSGPRGLNRQHPGAGLRGAALPLLLLFAQGSRPVGRLLAGEVVAVELVRMLVGSIGLVLSVPITTALAAAVITVDDAAVAGHHHGHDHDPDRDPDRTVQHGTARWEDFAPDEDVR
ncbi:MAG: YibE/F family protein [Acidimicrobiales bacterium]